MEFPRFSLLLLAVLLILPLCSAQQEDIRFWHPLSTNLTIYEKCRVDGAICDATYDCNISILTSNQTLLIDNDNMTRGAVYYSYSLSEPQTSPNGVYETTVDCTNVTFSGSNTFWYEITPNGSPPITEGQSTMALIGMALLIIVALYLGYLGLKAANGVVSLGFVSFSILMMVFAVGMILNFFELSFGTFSTFIDNYSTIYIVLAVLGGVGVIGLIIWLVFFALKLYWANRGVVEDKFRGG